MSKANPLEWFTVSGEGAEKELKYSGSPAIDHLLLQVLPLYQRTEKEGTLLSVPYTTVFQYLFYLREIALVLESAGSKAMIYLAAAVSDFYVSPSSMPDHKIQSTSELQLEFSHTPKMVRPLVLHWAPKAFTVTFKLETDEAVLLPRAKAALSSYGHQVVVANLLASHRTTVTMVTRAVTLVGSGCNDGQVSASVDATHLGVSAEWEALQLQLSRDDLSRGSELESLIIADLITRHQSYHHHVPVSTT